MCNHEHTSKAGKDRNGFQRFKCAECGLRFTQEHETVEGYRTSMADTVRVLSMLLEGLSVRSCERLTGIHRDTILGLMVEAGENCQRFMETVIRDVQTDAIECDEQWAFVGMKRRTAERKGLDGDECGDRYVFTAIDRDSKLLICWQAGERSQSETWNFMEKVRKAVVSCPTINTDGFNCYTAVVAKVFEGNVNFAECAKNYTTTAGNTAQVRYSPGSITSVTKKVICGEVPEAEIGTSRMERFNLSTRMHVRRFTRLTNAHSKKVRNHDAMLGLWFAFYNFVRHHSAIKTTPAVKAGIVAEKWSLEKATDGRCCGLNHLANEQHPEDNSGCVRLQGGQRWDHSSTAGDERRA